MGVLISRQEKNGKPPECLKLSIYVSVSVCGYMHVIVNACGGQRKYWIPPELQLQVIVSCPICMPETELETFVRAMWWFEGI